MHGLSSGRHDFMLLGRYTVIWNAWCKSTRIDTCENVCCATLEIYKALIGTRLLKGEGIWFTLTPGIDTSTLILIQNDVAN